MHLVVIHTAQVGSAKQRQMHFKSGWKNHIYTYIYIYKQVKTLGRTYIFKCSCLMSAFIKMHTTEKYIAFSHSGANLNDTCQVQKRSIIHYLDFNLSQNQKMLALQFCFSGLPQYLVQLIPKAIAGKKIFWWHFFISAALVWNRLHEMSKKTRLSKLCIK